MESEKMTNRRGFSLVEIMVTIAVSTLVLSGIVLTFNRITASANNAARGSSLTNTTRGLADLIKYDLQSAGRGIADLSALDIRYRFTPEYSGWESGDPEPEPYFYGIEDLIFNQTDETTEIILHTFDYDYSASGKGKNPTFVIAFDDDENWPDTGAYVGPVYLASNSQADLEGLANGDIIIFYKQHVFAEASAFEDHAIWNAGIVDVDGNPDNEALILQVGTVGDITAESHALGLDFEAAVTFQYGPIFDNNPPDTNRLNTRWEKPAETFSTGMSDTLGIPKNTFLGRKLGDGNSFNRIHYYVTRASDDDPIVLIRSVNGVEQVVATGVTDFSIRLGIDVPLDLSPDSIDRKTHMDGYVSRLDSSAWTRGFEDTVNPWASLSNADFKRVIGRHAIAAEVSFTQESLEGDTAEKDGHNRSRTFVQQFTIANAKLPMSGNY
jgi:prepilin-type N-terminal cleavage/methylation domain-containing protein